uniref:Lipocalin n=1 Tax=Rhipicephalus appendiculatus TaxID=34631 RepID=A0A131YS56_RHIAP
MMMQYKCRLPFFLIMYHAILFGSGLSSADNPSIMRYVNKMLESQTPVVLLWANERPDSLGERACWLSQYEEYSPSGHVHFLYHGNENNPLTSPANRRNKGWMAYSLLTSGGRVMLKITHMGGTFAGLKDGQEFSILYANERCFIVEVPKFIGHGVSCTAWVPANTAHHIHKDCKHAFTKLCQACKKTENKPSETAK